MLHIVSLLNNVRMMNGKVIAGGTHQRGSVSLIDYIVDLWLMLIDVLLNAIGSVIYGGKLNLFFVSIH